MKVAITGTIGSGKSEMSNYLRSKYGLFVFDADKTNSEILKNNPFLLKKDFSDCFDGDILNKHKLADVIFNDISQRKRLETIMHPLILEEMFKVQKSYNPFYAEVPLLFESGWDKYFDLKVLIVSDEKIALKRLKQRGLSEEESKARIKNQMSINDKMAKSDVIIYNNFTMASFYKEIDDWISNVR